MARHAADSMQGRSTRLCSSLFYECPRVEPPVLSSDSPRLGFGRFSLANWKPQEEQQGTMCTTKFGQVLTFLALSHVSVAAGWHSPSGAAALSLQLRGGKATHCASVSATPCEVPSPGNSSGSGWRYRAYQDKDGDDLTVFLFASHNDAFKLLGIPQCRWAGTCLCTPRTGTTAASMPKRTRPLRVF